MRSKRTQKGIQLVEVLIAMAIGSIIALAITRAYMSSFKIQGSQSGAMRLNETARFAFDLLGKELKLAGFSNTWQVGSVSSRFCASTTGSAIVGQNDATGTIDPASTDFSGTAYTVDNKSDVIRVRYFGEDGSSQTSPVLDCHGYAVPSNATAPVEDTLFVATDPGTGEPSLYCDTSNPHAGGAPRALPLVTGVESMQLLYGMDSNADGLVDSYVPWNLVGSNTDLITTVKISLVVRSPNDSAPNASSKTFQHFGNSAYPAAIQATNSDTGATFTTPSDKRLRTIALTEVGLRNFSYCN